MSGRRARTAVLCWLPVTAAVVALHVVPSSTGTSSAAATLNVTPGANSYGGQQVVFSGDMGSGQQRIRLQRTGSLGAPWADVVDPRTGRTFTRLTNGDGTFRFEFPAPAMNAVYFRVASAGAASSPHLFQSKHQDADVSLIETAPADVPLPRGYAVVGEPFRVAVDTAEHDRSGKPTKPILVGRDVTLQVRDGAVWKAAGRTGSVGRDGRLAFDPETRSSVTKVADVYRVVLENWTEDGDRVGWFPSMPFYLDVVKRPEPVAALTAIPADTSVTLGWLPSPDPARAKIVIARSASGSEPTAADPSDVIATLPGNALSYTDQPLSPGSTYRYAVYTVSADGVYTELEQRRTVTTLNAKRGED